MFATKDQLDIASIGVSKIDVALTTTVRKVGTKMQDFYNAVITFGGNSYVPVGTNGVEITFPTKDAAVNWVGSAANDNVNVVVALAPAEGAKLWKKPLYKTVALKNAALKTKLQAGVMSATAALTKATATKTSYDALGYSTSAVPAVIAMYAAVTGEIANINAAITDYNAKIATL